MSTTRILGPTLFSVVIVAAGCGGGSGSFPDAANFADAGGGTTIQQIQSDTMAVGTPVTVRGVVVTAIDTYGAQTGSIWVEEPDGGAYSGVYVYLQGTQAAALSLGDRVDIQGGVKEEYAPKGDTSGRTRTEIAAPTGGQVTVTKVGAGSVPDPKVLNPWDLAADDTVAEKWEGVLIKFENVAVVSAPKTVGKADPTLLSMKVTGPFEVESSLAPLDATIKLNDCYASITGIEDYLYNYELLPRVGDLSAGGSGCPAQEAGKAACTDGKDNDHDGFADCADYSCQESYPACTTDETVVAVQDGSVGSNMSVKLSGVVVTAVDSANRNFWIQDAGGAAQYNGVYVFRGNAVTTTPVPSFVVPGEVIDLTGDTTEYKTLTEISAPQGGKLTITDDMSKDSVELLPGPTLSELADPSDSGAGEAYEGTVVELQNVKVASVDTVKGQFTISDASGSLLVDKLIYDASGTVSVGDCFLAINGVMHLESGTRVLLPRGLGDLVTGGTCP